MGTYNDGWMHSGGMTTGGVFMWIIIAVLVVLLIAALVKFLGNSGGRSETALESLKKRYAQGEISKTEFEKIKKDLL